MNYNHEIATQKLKKTNVLPHLDLNCGFLELKASVLPISKIAAKLL